jgi:hypothetical protein
MRAFAQPAQVAGISIPCLVAAQVPGYAAADIH